jgi:hypothetical protein
VAAQTDCNRKDRNTTIAQDPVSGDGVAADRTTTSAPQDPGAGLGEHEVEAILDYKKKHPSMGPAQIRAQSSASLAGACRSRRSRACCARRATRRCTARAGRLATSIRAGSRLAPHRNAIWQLDFTELRFGAERRWLLVTEDDDGPTSEVVALLARVCASIVADYDRSWLAGPRPEWIRRAKAKLKTVFADLVDATTRRGRQPCALREDRAVPVELIRQGACGSWRVLRLRFVVAVAL